MTAAQLGSISVYLHFLMYVRVVMKVTLLSITLVYENASLS